MTIICTIRVYYIEECTNVSVLPELSVVGSEVGMKVKLGVGPVVRFGIELGVGPAVGFGVELEVG